MPELTLVIVNKYWECDPICHVLYSQYLKDVGNLSLPMAGLTKSATYPYYGPVKHPYGSPRIRIIEGDRQADIWCISDLLTARSSEEQSSSEAKMAVMNTIFQHYINSNIDLSTTLKLVIAVGTASGGPEIQRNPAISTDNINGSVAIGCRAFMHDSYVQGKAVGHYYNEKYFGKILDSSAKEFVSRLKAKNSDFSSLLLAPPTNPTSKTRQMYIDADHVALGSINVTDYTLYAQKDEETANHYLSVCGSDSDKYKGASLETTHGLIYAITLDWLRKVSSGNVTIPPFIFISGVVDRYLKFDDDVNPTVYAQNVSGAHNAGVAVAFALQQFFTR